MKQTAFYKLIFIVIGFAIPSLVAAQESWKEGEHYTVISSKASDDKQIREVFSFWCPHCYTFESIAKELKTKLPSDVTFIKAHVNFMGSTTKEAQNDATSAMLAASALGQEDMFNQALFEAIHKDRKNVTGMQDILTIFAEAGGDSEKLLRMTKSFGIRGKVSKNNKLTTGVSSVPTFIVNNKYQAIFTRNMTPDQFISLLLWLTTQK
ncbi:thiol:disulfide interchange protein DsbA/DsbL [Aliiglaciecola litoralis]|uniref:Thiol:disulfide interchange protein n=1 Tax=Aliiglaciecola litoralis TaxID=582857 RepID=A0ABP3X5E3_9ALTE